MIGLLLGSFLITAATGSDAANPRRRVPPLERLKRRSASARWDELRQTWRFDHNGGESSPSNDDAQPPDTESDAAAIEELESPAEVNAGSVRPGPSSSRAAVIAPEPTKDVLVGFEGPTGLDDSNAGVIDETLEPQTAPGRAPLLSPAVPLRSDRKSQAKRGWTFVAQEDAIGNQDENRQDGMGLRTATTANVLPKPITEILPYYDYAPNGEDPCDYLCPRPPGCPEGDDSKPCPVSVSMPNITPDGRSFVDMHVLWEPSNLFHNPLYFEDHALERYGHTHNDVLQPFVSVGKFGAQLIGLPYQMALHPICEEQYTLGWHRPGECIPYRYHVPPWNTKAAAVAGGVYTGLIFLIP